MNDFKRGQTVVVADSTSARPAILARIYELGLNPTKVAAALDLSTHQVYRVANGLAAVPESELEAWADKLQWTVEQFRAELKAARDEADRKTEAAK